MRQPKNPEDMEEELRYKIGLSLLPKIGNTIARSLLAYFGSSKAVLAQPAKQLQKAPGVGPQIAELIASASPLERADKEIDFIQRHHITPLFFLDKGYPERLKHCADAPVMLYSRGEADFQAQRVLSVVGTRSATRYGLEQCGQLIADVAARYPHTLIISGLAYGIDICAHEAAMRNHLPTAAVLGHGLHTIYPSIHRNIAGDMLKKGGAVITEFLSKSMYKRQNFLQRNRIIAGLADATIVVESGKKGGALVTADIAVSYNRDVFAFPGRVGDAYSEGANWLIKTKKAALIEGIKDLEYELGWESDKAPKKPVQATLFHELSKEEQLVSNAMKNKGALPIDHIALHAGMPVSKVATILLNMEFAGLVASLPGKMYELTGQVSN